MKACHLCAKPAKLGLCLGCAGRAEVALLNPEWTPFAAAPVTDADVKTQGFETAYKNSRYQVLLRIYDTEQGRAFHLSIKRNDREPIHDWRDLQRIKNELVGEDEEAVEIYPKESRLVDTSNQYHLWGILGMSVPFGYRERLVAEGVSPLGAKQRPFEEKPHDLAPMNELIKKAEEYAKRKRDERGSVS